MIGRKMEKATMHALAYFLKLNIPFAKPETGLTFEKICGSFARNRLVLRIEEQIKHMPIAEDKVKEVQNFINYWVWMTQNTAYLLIKLNQYVAKNYLYKK